MAELTRTKKETEEGIEYLYEGEHVKATVQMLSDDTAYLSRIDVEEGFRGQGIGTEALKAIRKDFWKLYYAPDNEDAERLYARLGTKVIGDEVDEYLPSDLECLYYLDQGFGIYEL